MRRIIVLALVVLFFTSQIGAQQEVTIEFSNTHFTLKFAENDISSSQLQLETNNLPDLMGHNIVVRLNENISKIVGETGEIEFDTNVIATTQLIQINFQVNDSEINLLEKEISTGVWVHMKHVYSNWTFGTPPPPDNRGLGQGTLLDLLALEEMLGSEISTVDEGSEIAEKILNLLIGADQENQFTDWNNDGSGESISDGFGLFEYTFGFRDHVVNAGNAEDPPGDVKDAADIVYNNLSGSIISTSGYSGFIDPSNLNTSSADLAQIYQDALFMLDNTNLTQIKSTALEILTLLQDRILPISYDNFNYFKNVVSEIDDTVDLIVTLQDMTTSDTSDSSIAFLPFLVIMLIPLLKRKKTSTS